MSNASDPATHRPIGILGGSFDPVHNAHLALARAALEDLALDRVVWIPGGTPPHRAAPLASPAQRIAMLRLALAGESRFALDAREIAKTTPCYTVETLEDLRAELGVKANLVLLIGADQHARLDTWHRWQDLFTLARIAVFARPGLDFAPSARVTVVPITPLDISSSAIRARIAAGDPPRGLLPDAVLDYIGREHLYS
ncbi:MAG: nicotinate (nicotinamide) nucleotide adenylyltransferase [Betaproteobacteria bacterium]|nr:nicotinate (nicotinamide) nucleotide adenylyltransferase [Betaproteobacteria bacterium]